MLPFLKAKKMGSVVGVAVNPDGQSKSTGPIDEMDPGLMSAAEDLLSGIAMKDAAAVAEALRSAFYLLDSMPHEEGGEEVGDVD